LAPNCTTVSMLTFRVVTLRWMDWAVAWLAVPAPAASNAASAKVCLRVRLPHRIVLPRLLSTPARSLACQGPVWTIVDVLTAPNCATVPAFIVPICEIRLVAA
jgi:hypothetical protein